MGNTNSISLDCKTIKICFCYEKGAKQSYVVIPFTQPAQMRMAVGADVLIGPLLKRQSFEKRGAMRTSPPTFAPFPGAHGIVWLNKRDNHVILCSQKNEAIVKYSVLNDAQQIFASRYRLALPTAEELQHEIETERKRIEEQREE